LSIRAPGLADDIAILQPGVDRARRFLWLQPVTKKISPVGRKSLEPKSSHGSTDSRPTDLKNRLTRRKNRFDTLRAAGTMVVMPKEDEKLSLEESLEKLESLREQILDSAAVNQRVYDAVEKELGRIAREFFPGMNTCWQAEQFRELQNEISFLSSLYWQKLSSLDYQAKQSQSS
jgi:hypothetical protein